MKLDKTSHILSARMSLIQSFAIPHNYQQVTLNTADIFEFSQFSNHRIHGTRISENIVASNDA